MEEFQPPPVSRPPVGPEPLLLDSEAEAFSISFGNLSAFVGQTLMHLAQSVHDAASQITIPHLQNNQMAGNKGSGKQGGQEVQ
ncbi:MAG: hypothetical protein M5U01_33315 [Ardenticatenaceae bacterium]|nr:hypothetical protein [Ardenticatenaceae bacterium]